MPGFRYVVYDPRRGYVSTHRTERAALRAPAEDARRCVRAGTPSDPEVHRWRDEWAPIDPEVNVKLVEE